MADKIYEITSINWLHFALEAKETNLSIGDVEESELWDVAELEDFRIRLINDDGAAEIIDMAKWKKDKRV